MKLGKRLVQRRAAAQRVEEIRERIRDLREAMTRITPRYEASGGGSSAEDKMMSYAARLDTLERALERASRRAYRVSMDALESIRDLPEDQYAVIVCRDFLGLSWRRTAERTGYGVMRCRRLREQALGHKKRG